MAFSIADVESWTPADVEAVGASLDMLLWYEDFSAFAKAFWKTADSTKVVWSWHMDTLCKEAQALFMTSMQRRRQYDAIVTECGADHALRDQRITDEIDATPLRLVLLVPPRGSKTTLIARLFVVWCWLYHPLEIATFCAMEHNLKILGPAIYRIIRSQQYQALVAYLIQTGLMKNPVSCRRGTGAMMNLNLEHGGRWIGFVIEGNWTGQNVDVALIDDPHDVNEAMGRLRSTESKSNAVAKVEDVYTNKIGDRFNNHIYGLTILIMQRVHLNDLAAVMIREGARVVTIPAEVDDLEAFQRIKHPDDPRTEVGQSYNPSRLPPAVMRRRRREDPFGYATKYLMTPTLQEGSTIKREWFKNEYNDDPHALARVCSDVSISIDSASTTNKRSDYTSMGVWGRLGRRRILLDRRFGKWGIFGLVEEFKALVDEWPEAGFKLIENKSSGIQLIQAADRLGISGVIPVNPVGAKRDRLGYAKAALEAGDVWIPAHAPWKEEFVTNMVGIDAGGAHDDDGDMMSQVMERWATGARPWLTAENRAEIGDLRPGGVVGHAIRWDRPTPGQGVYVGVVPGWAHGQPGSEACAMFLNAQGEMLSLVEVGSGGVAAFVAAVIEESERFGVISGGRWAEIDGKPTLESIQPIMRAKVRMGGNIKFLGEKGAGYRGKKEEIAELWSALLGLMSIGWVKVRDGRTLSLLESVVEDGGVPRMVDGGVPSGRLLAFLLAVQAVRAVAPSTDGLPNRIDYTPQPKTLTDIWEGMRVQLTGRVR